MQDLNDIPNIFVEDMFNWVWNLLLFFFVGIQFLMLVTMFIVLLQNLLTDDYHKHSALGKISTGSFKKVSGFVFLTGIVPSLILLVLNFSIPGNWKFYPLTGILRPDLPNILIDPFPDGVGIFNGMGLFELINTVFEYFSLLLVAIGIFYTAYFFIQKITADHDADARIKRVRYWKGIYFLVFFTVLWSFVNVSF